MAIAYGEYGPYDTETGQYVVNLGGEAGSNWQTAGSEVAAPVSYGTGSAPFAGTQQRPDSDYIYRGNYRMPKGFNQRTPAGPLEFKDANGNWSVVTAETAPSGYDPRQDSSVQGSNERLRFDQAFGTAPADVPITGMQQWAIANGWREPDRSYNPNTLGSIISETAPYVGLMLGGVGALNGLAGLSGLGGAEALAAGDAMAGAIPAGELGAWTGATAGAGSAGSLGDLMGGLGDTTADLAAGSTGGSGAMDFTNLWDYGSGAADAASNTPMTLDQLFGVTNTGQMSSAGVLESATGNAGWDSLFGQTLGEGASLAGAVSPDLWTSISNWMAANPGSTLKSAASALGLGGSGSSLLGTLGVAGLNAYASGQQTDALNEMAQRYEGYGAPYRQKLSDLYANPDSFLNSNEVRKPVQQGTDMLMRSLSMQGNPFGSGNALQQGQSYASDQLFSRLGQEKDRLAGFGGLASYNAAAPQAATNAISSGQGAYIGAAKAAGDIFNPPQTPAQQAAEWMRVMGR